MNGGGKADVRKGRYQTDGGGRQMPMPVSVTMKVYFAAHLVTRATEEEGPQGPDQEAGGEQGDRC